MLARLGFFLILALAAIGIHSTNYGSSYTGKCVQLEKETNTTIYPDRFLCLEVEFHMGAINFSVTAINKTTDILNIYVRFCHYATEKFVLEDMSDVDSVAMELPENVKNDKVFEGCTFRVLIATEHTQIDVQIIDNNWKQDKATKNKEADHENSYLSSFFALATLVTSTYVLFVCFYNMGQM